jgi:uncharacterized protein (DUF1697 family)
MARSPRKPAGTLDVHVALLRGINVGGKHILPMAALAALFTEAGCADVRTYVQSGNVVFRAPPALARRIPQAVAAALREGFGIAAPVLTRSAAELRAVAEGNPFLAEGADPARLHVAFLQERPDAARVAALDPARSPPDAFRVQGREVYLLCPNGFARTKLSTAWFDSRLATTSTVRNWNTVRKLLALARG